MRFWHLVTVAGLAVARDSVRAQSVMLGAQAIPLVTRADPTPTRAPLAEGYLSQPIVALHATWGPAFSIGTFDFEGLTLSRGELNTGGYGEGYVDRRHPHTYLHELLVGGTARAFGADASLAVGRGFVPFGSDDPMVRPFEKYPVNHHLAQILERVLLVGAIQRGPVIAEAALFNGDEPAAPGAAPNYGRLADSWASRLTLVPLDGLELSASVARVRSPEQRTGGGLDQHKLSAVARYARQTPRTSRYALVEWARTNERYQGETVTGLGSVLAEAAYCRAGFQLAARLERTGRAEEERLADPFRTPRPAADLSNLGVSRWTAVTVAFSLPAVRTGRLSTRPFVEVERLGAVRGDPPGLFDPELRYGARSFWMLSAGARLAVGMPHMRMGRYGAALPGQRRGTHPHAGGSLSHGAMHDGPAHDPAARVGHAGPMTGEASSVRQPVSQCAP